MSDFALAVADQNQRLRLALEAIRDLRVAVPATKTVVELKRIAREALEK